MSYKPDEQTLVSYLYGELDEKAKSKVDQYFIDHPEDLRKLQELSNTREIMGSIGDKEVIAPPVIMDDRSSVRSLWQSSFLRMTASIAASFLIIVVAARLLGTELSYSDGELRISLGKQSATGPSEQDPGMTAQAVQTMINASLEKNNESIAEQWADHQKKIDESIGRQLAVNTRKMNEVMKTASQASEEQVRAFVGSLQDENLRLMKDYLEMSTQEQKKYVETLLVEFSQYLQNQREQDLTVFQARLSTMEQNTDQFKQETEQLLSSIISTASVQDKKNSY